MPKLPNHHCAICGHRAETTGRLRLNNGSTVRYPVCNQCLDIRDEKFLQERLLSGRPQNARLGNRIV